jgi:hypothetical protein
MYGIDQPPQHLTDFISSWAAGGDITNILREVCLKWENIAIKLASSTKHNREGEDQRNQRDSGIPTERDRNKEIKEKEMKASNKRSWKKRQRKNRTLRAWTTEDQTEPNCWHGASTATPGETWPRKILPYSSETEWSLFNCLQLNWQKPWVPLQVPLLNHLSWNHSLWFIPPKQRNSPSSKPPGYHRIWWTFHSHMSPAPTVVANSHL